MIFTIARPDGRRTTELTCACGWTATCATRLELTLTRRAHAATHHPRKP